MSVAGGPTALVGMYRLVSTPLVNGVKHGALNDNIAFNTNIPFPSYAMKISRIRWFNTFSALGALTSSGTHDIQFFAQLTENQTKTVVNIADSSYLDEFVYTVAGVQATAAAINELPSPQGEVIHEFYGSLGIYTVATKFNLVASALELTGAIDATTAWKPVCTIEYQIVPLTPDLSSYLTKRLQIQGS